MTIKYRILTLDGDAFEGAVPGTDAIGISGGALMRLEDESGVDLWVPINNVSYMKTEEV